MAQRKNRRFHGDVHIISNCKPATSIQNASGIDERMFANRHAIRLVQEHSHMNARTASKPDPDEMAIEKTPKAIEWNARDTSIRHGLVQHQ